MAKKQKLINLLPQEEFAASTAGRILAWTLSTFRIIVIVVEMVIMSAFLSRFWLDARNADLNDEIDQKQAIVVASQDFETAFRNAQKKLAIVSELGDVESNPAQLLSDVTSGMPLDISLSNYTFTDELIKVKGVSSSEQSIAQFMANLSENIAFEDINLTQLDTEEDQFSLLLFGLDLTTQEGEAN